MGTAESRELAGPGNYIILPGQKPSGQPILSALLKRTYNIAASGSVTRAIEDQPLTPGDKFWDSPLNSSVKMESDFVPFKLRTDVVFNATATAPRGPCQKLLAAIQIGDIRKELLVIGDRQAMFVGGANPRFTDPLPFEQMELKYERAYGGCDVRSFKSVPHPYPCNPVGRGFVLANTLETIHQLPLPNLEDPQDQLTPDRLCVGEFKKWESMPLPAGLSWHAKTWLPRAGFAGIMPGDRQTEQEMRAVYAQLVPPAQREAYEKTRIKDMDFRFFSGASMGLTLPYLKGGERIRTEHLSKNGRLEFQLPADSPIINIDIGEGLQCPEIVMQTVMIDLIQNSFDIVWRGAVEYPGMDWLPQMQKLEVNIL